MRMKCSLNGDKSGNTRKMQIWNGLATVVSGVLHCLFLVIRLERLMVIEFVACLLYMFNHLRRFGRVHGRVLPPSTTLDLFQDYFDRLAFLALLLQSFLRLVAYEWNRRDSLLQRLVRTIRRTMPQLVEKGEGAPEPIHIPLYLENGMGIGMDTQNDPATLALNMPSLALYEEKVFNEYCNVFAAVAACAPIFCKLTGFRADQSNSRSKTSVALSSLRQVTDQCHATEKYLQRILDRNATRYDQVYKKLKMNVSNQKCHISNNKRTCTDEVLNRNVAMEKCKVLEEGMKELEQSADAHLKEITELKTQLDNALESLEAERQVRTLAETSLPIRTGAIDWSEDDPDQGGWVAESFSQVLALERSRNLGRQVLYEHALARQLSELERKATNSPRANDSCEVEPTVMVGQTREAVLLMEEERSRLKSELDEANASLVSHQLAVFSMRQEFLDTKSEYERLVERSVEIQLQLAAQVEQLKADRTEEIAEEKRVNAAERQVLANVLENERSVHKKELDELRKENELLKTSSSKAQRDIASNYEDIPNQLFSNEKNTGREELVQAPASNTSLSRQILGVIAWGEVDNDSFGLFKKELNGLYSALDKEQKRVNELSAEIASLQAQLAARLTTVDVLCEQLARKSKKVEELEQNSEPKDKEIARLQEDLERLEVEREEAREEVSREKVMVNELNTEVKQLWVRVEEMEAESRVKSLVDETIADASSCQSPGTMTACDGSETRTDNTSRMAPVTAPVSCDGPLPGAFFYSTSGTAGPSNVASYPISRQHSLPIRSSSCFISGVNSRPYLDSRATLGLRDTRSVTPKDTRDVDMYSHPGLYPPARRPPSSNNLWRINSYGAYNMYGLDLPDGSEEGRASNMPVPTRLPSASHPLQDVYSYR